VGSPQKCECLRGGLGVRCLQDGISFGSQAAEREELDGIEKMSEAVDVPQESHSNDDER